MYKRILIDKRPVDHSLQTAVLIVEASLLQHVLQNLKPSTTRIAKFEVLLKFMALVPESS